MTNLKPVILFCLLISLIGSSCVVHEDILSFQKNIPVEPVVYNSPGVRIQPNDVLDIKVYSSDVAAAAPFNLGPVERINAFGDLEAIQLNGYLVDPDGNVIFPVLGTIKLEGLTTAESKQLITDKLNSYLKDPVVNMRLMNFRITVSGEVKQPGSFTIVNERITLPEAISRAGDFTNYADRSKILVIREVGGLRTFKHIDIQDVNFFQSEYYYLKQNDLIYIEPLKAKIGAIGDQSNETVSFVVGGATLIAVIVGLLKK